MADATRWTERSSHFARRLAELRQARGLSVENLAFAAGLSHVAVYKLENQGPPPSNPQLRTLYALADALGVEASELID